MKDEIRYFPIEEFRIDTSTEGVRKLVGYAAVFGTLSKDMGGFKEKISSGAFTDSIRSDDIWALWAHDPSLVLGRKSAGTLNLIEDEHGLRSEIIVPDTQAGRDALISVERGDVDQMSFRFRVKDGQNDQSFQRINGGIIRSLDKLTLMEVSPTPLPVYPNTEVEARSSLLDEAIRSGRIPPVEGDEGGNPQGRYIDTLQRKIKLDEDEEKEY